MIRSILTLSCLGVCGFVTACSGVAPSSEPTGTRYAVNDPGAAVRQRGTRAVVQPPPCDDDAGTTN